MIFVLFLHHGSQILVPTRRDSPDAVAPGKAKALSHYFFEAYPCEYLGRRRSP